MDSTFLRMLAVPSKICKICKIDFCKIPTLYDIPNLFKLHSKSFGMDPSAPMIIDSVNVSLSHILANFLIVVQSSYPVFRFFSESVYRRDIQH